MAAASPNVFNRSRMAESDESMIASDRILAQEEAKFGHRGDVWHRVIGGVVSEPAEIGKIDDGGEASSVDGEFAIMHIQRKQTVELRKFCNTLVCERAA